MFYFENLEVYRNAVELADDVIKLTKRFPPDFRFLKDQLRRAATSICLNIAEGNGKFHQKERNQYFVVARSSGCECVPIVELCVRNNLIRTGSGAELRKTLGEIFAMLNGLIRRRKQKGE